MITSPKKCTKKQKENKKDKEGKLYECGQKLQTCSYNINKHQGYNTKHSDYG